MTYNIFAQLLTTLQRNLDEFSVSDSLDKQEKSLNSAKDLVQQCLQYVDSLNGDIQEKVIKSEAISVEDAVTAYQNGNLYVELTDFIDENTWFSDSGLMAKLTKIVSRAEDECVDLTFDGSMFEAFNISKMEKSYYPNNVTKRKVAEGTLQEDSLYTAYQAGMYKAKEDIYYSVIIDDDLVISPSVKQVIQSLMTNQNVIFKTIN